MKIAVTVEFGTFVVWAMLDDESQSSKPHERGESFVLAEGPTLPVALDKARKVLVRVAQELEVCEFDHAAAEALVVS